MTTSVSAYIKTLEGTLRSSPFGGKPDDSLPKSHEELLEILKKVFPDTLPSEDEFKEHPEIIWIRYGTQRVLQFLESRIAFEKRKRAIEKHTEYTRPAGGP